MAAGQAHAVLYSGAGRLGDATAAEVAQRQPERVLLVGGARTLHPAIEDEIVRIAPASFVTRVAGDDAISTQADAARRVPSWLVSALVIAHGWMPGEIGIAASLVDIAPLQRRRTPPENL